MNSLTPETLTYSAQDDRDNRRDALLSIVGFWAFYFVINTIHTALAMEQAQLPLMVRRAFVVVVGIGLTYLLYRFLRRLEGKSMRCLVPAVFLGSAPTAMIYGAVNFTAFYLINPPESEIKELAEMTAKHASQLNIVAETAIEWYFFIVAWCAFYLALDYAAKVRLVERKAATYRAEAQAAELRALRYQVNPHFLFNTLNSLSTLVLRQRTADAERMIMNLSTFFRSSLAVDAVDDVPLGDEIRTQQLYLDIEQVRFPARLIVAIDVPTALETVPVPSLILQPLVENAVKHGVSRTTDPVTISIGARTESGMLLLTVEDNAISTAKTASGEGIGLKNVRDRLAARFDGQARYSYGPRPGGGFRVEIALPMKTHRAEPEHEDGDD